MNAALPLPMRILVKGASPVVWVSDISGPRSDFAFPRVIESELCAAGRPALMRTEAATGESARTLLRTLEREVIAWSPDVIVMHIGNYDAVHLFIPRWFERHVNTPSARPTRLRRFYRKKILYNTYLLLRAIQKLVDRALPARVWTRYRDHITTVATQYIKVASTVGSPLVIVTSVPPGASRFTNAFPKLNDRLAMLNEGYKAMVDRFDSPNVVWLDVVELYESAGATIEEVSPDGGHYTSKWHRVFGEAIAQVITKWADGQEHLAPRGSH